MRRIDRLGVKLWGSVLVLTLASARSAIADGSGLPAVQAEVALNQAEEAYAEGRYQEASRDAEYVVAQSTGTTAADVAHRTMGNYVLGLSSVQLGEYTVADAALTQVLPAVAAVDHPELAAFGYTALASMYFAQLRLLRAGPAAIQALVADKKNVGVAAQSPKDVQGLANLFETALSSPNAPIRDLIALAIVENSIGNHLKAATLLSRAIAARPVPSVGRLAVRDLAVVEVETGNREKARILLSSLAKADEASNGQEPVLLADDLNALAAFESDAGSVEQASIYIARAIAVELRAPDFKLPYVTSLNVEGQVLLNEGDFGKAQEVLNESLQSRGSDLTVDGAFRADAQLALMQIDFAQGRFPDVSEFIKIVKLYMADGFDQQIVSTCILASQLIGSVGNADQSLKLAKFGSDFLVQEHREEDLEYLRALDILGIAYIRSGDLASAEKTYRLALSNPNVTSNSNASFVFDIKTNLAYVLSEQKHKSEEAAQLIQTTIHQEDTAKPIPSDALTNSWKIAFWVYERQDDQANAAVAVRNALGLAQQQYEASLTGLSERDRLSYVGAYNYQTAFLYSYCERVNSDECNGIMYDAILWQKDMVASGIADVQSRVNASNDPAVRRAFRRLQEARSELASVKLVEAQGRPELSPTADGLELRVNTLERDLISRLPGLRGSRRVTATWRDVRRSLAPGDAAVEIVRYPYNTGDSLYSLGEARYAALVLTPSMASPFFIDLGPASSFERTAWADYVRTLAGEPSTGVTYRLAWKPIQAALGSARRIYLSPDGVFNKVSFAAIPDDSGSPLMTRYQFRVVSNSGDITRRTSLSSQGKKTAVLFGDPTFDSEKVTGTAGTLRDVSSLVSNTQVASLPNTATEIQNVASMLHSGGWQVAALSGDAATKSALLAVDHPRLLHVATHGYFVSESEARAMSKNMPKWYADDVLIRTGLFLAGSGSPLPATRANGILTAYEASGLNLQGTELVVLSACDTGLGESENGEGVLGLRRALHEAGAKAILISLWSVPDRETEELMSDFYRRWLGGTEMHDALGAAELELRKKVIERYGHDVPKYWAGFVLSD